MTTLSHVAVGYLIAKGASTWGFIPPEVGNHIYLYSIVASNIPDVDGLALVWKIYDHRHNSPFHYPLTWLIILTTSAGISWLVGVNWLFWYIRLAGLCIFFHFLMDSVGFNAGIRWLGPFSQKEFSFWPLTDGALENFRDFAPWLRRYLRHKIMIVELIIWIAALTALSGQINP